MALYGPQTTPSQIPFTGFSPTLGAADAITPVTAGYVYFDGITQDDFRINRLFFEGQNRVARRLLRTLIGANAGSNATENRTRVQAAQSTFSPTDNGGLVPVETVALVNRNTTAADVTMFQALLDRVVQPSSYPTDVSGMGGGGKLGF